MRPLNRPMFRYGGPIKEGIMDGIREPKKNGGLSKQFNTGLVGDERYPKTDGREHHVAFLAPIAMAGLRMAARPFGKFVMRQMAGPLKKSTPIKNLNLNLKGTPVKGGFQAERFDPNFIGKAFINDPLAKSVMTGSTFAGRGLKSAGKGIYNVGKYATTTPSGLAFLGAPVVYQAGKYFLSDGTEIKGDDIKQIKQVGPPGGGETRLGSKEAVYDAPKKGGGVELSDKELRQKRIDRYRDIMDIKGMNKDAAYNSLIAASQLINQSGDFKGDIKSGKLINDIIQATSKQFDKPKKTKDAIDTLILKGEIEKDIKASDPANKVLNELRAGQLQKINKELEGTSFAEAKIAASKTMSGQSGIDAAASVSSDNFRGNLLTKTQLTDVMEKAKGSGEISEQDIIIAATTEVIKGKNLPDGDYTVGDVLVTITEGQVTDIKR